MTSTNTVQSAGGQPQTRASRRNYSEGELGPLPAAGDTSGQSMRLRNKARGSGGTTPDGGTGAASASPNRGTERKTPDRQVTAAPLESGTARKAAPEPRMLSAPRECGDRRRDSHGSSHSRITITPGQTPPATPRPSPVLSRDMSIKASASPKAIAVAVTHSPTTPTAPIPSVSPDTSPALPFGPGPVSYLQVECDLPDYACAHPTLHSSPRVVDLSSTANWISPHKVTRTTASVDAVWASLRCVVAALHAEAATFAEYTPPSASRRGQGTAAKREAKEVSLEYVGAVEDTSPRFSAPRASTLRDTLTSSRLSRSTGDYRPSVASIAPPHAPKITAAGPLRSAAGDIAVPISAPFQLPESLVGHQDKRHAIYLAGPGIPMPRAREAAIPALARECMERSGWAGIRATLAVFDGLCAIAAGLDAQMTDMNNGSLPFNLEMAAGPAVDLAVYVGLIRLLGHALLESYAALEFNRRTRRRIRSFFRHVTAVCKEFGGEYVYMDRVPSEQRVLFKDRGVVLRAVGQPRAGHTVPTPAALTPAIRKPPTVRFAPSVTGTSGVSVDKETGSRAQSTASAIPTSTGERRTASLFSKLSRRPRPPDGQGCSTA